MNCGRENAMVWMRGIESTGRRPVEFPTKIICATSNPGIYDPRETWLWPSVPHSCLKDCLGRACWRFVKLKKYFIFLINFPFMPSVFNLISDSSSKSSVNELLLCGWRCPYNVWKYVLHSTPICYRIWDFKSTIILEILFWALMQCHLL